MGWFFAKMSSMPQVNIRTYMMHIEKGYWLRDDVGRVALLFGGTVLWRAPTGYLFRRPLVDPSGMPTDILGYSALMGRYNALRLAGVSLLLDRGHQRDWGTRVYALDESNPKKLVRLRYHQGSHTFPLRGSNVALWAKLKVLAASFMFLKLDVGLYTAPRVSLVPLSGGAALIPVPHIELGLNHNLDLEPDCS